MMSRFSRCLLVIAGVLLAASLRLPLWRIALTAPQYPEGLGLQIGAGTIAGATPQDLGNINELNHYIGMRPIDPGALPELRILPWLLASLAVLALIAAALGSRRLVAAWLGAVVLVGAAGSPICTDGPIRSATTSTPSTPSSRCPAWCTSRR